MNTYQIEIQDLKTKQLRKMRVAGCGWTDDAPEQYSRVMCDCNLAGYFHNELRKIAGNPTEEPMPHNVVAGNWLADHKCDHSMPPTRFKAIAAHLDNGTVVRL